MKLSTNYLFGVRYASVDYKTATDHIIAAAVRHQSYGVSALAVHGLMECVSHPRLKALVNQLDLVVPDGKPIQWSLNSLFNANLQDRVSGPDLTLHVLQQANIKGLNVYLYGSTEQTLNKFQRFIDLHFSNLTICGVHIDRFREATPEEDLEDIQKINASGAHLVLVGRGCPRQEVWVSEHLGKVNAAMLAVGAAFDYCAGNIKRAPHWMQQAGLEWFYRLMQEPDRLWKRYLITNSQFLRLLLIHKLGLEVAEERVIQAS